MCLNRFYRGKVQKLSTMTLSVDVTALVTSTDIKCFIPLTTNGGYTNWLLKCFKSRLISSFPYSSICDILTLLKKVVNFHFGVIKFFCRYMYICTYQDWLFWLITNIFLLEKEIYWNHKPRITIATKTHISHLYFSFFLSSSFWRQSFPSLSSQYFWLASSWCFFHWPGLHHYLHQLFQQLSFCFPYF